MNIIDQITSQLSALADKIPVEMFVFIGALIEEVVAPIPSPVVMTLAGTIAEAKEQPLIFLFYLSLIGAIGKSIGSYLLYVLADKLEDIFMGRYGKFFGVSHKEVEQFGKHFKGSFKDAIVVFFSRAIPIVPTAPVSIVCGAIKLPLKSYLISGFFGLLVRNIL
jgi:membrane protein DedA with SNARE-associated domain